MSGSPNICVAVVDDDDGLCRSLCRLLRAAGIQSVSYPSAESFLGDGGRSRFDCLVFDVQLGGMSGLELNQRLVESGSTTPVIFNTARDDAELRQQALQTGCVACLRKNESGHAVLAAIRYAIQPGNNGTSRREQ